MHFNSSDHSNKLFYPLIISAFGLFMLSISCSKKESVTIRFPEKMSERINFNESDFWLIYHHSGECSLCYGTILALMQEFPNIPIISISTSSGRVLTDYYLDEIGFNGISLIDSSSLFLNYNNSIIKTEKIILIDKKLKVIHFADQLDNTTKKSIKNAIH